MICSTCTTKISQLVLISNTNNNRVIRSLSNKISQLVVICRQNWLENLLRIHQVRERGGVYQHRIEWYSDSFDPLAVLIKSIKLHYGFRQLIMNFTKIWCLYFYCNWMKVAYGVILNFVVLFQTLQKVCVGFENRGLACVGSNKSKWHGHGDNYLTQTK